MAGHRTGETVSATAATLAVLRTSSRLLEELAPVFAEHDITPARFDVLDALGKLGKPARPADLRARLQLPAQTMTGVLDQLQRQGLITRTANPRDRRSILIELTTNGRAVIDTVCPPLIDIENDCMATLTPNERATLLKLLGKVEQRIHNRRDLAGREIRA